jgi:hypothetical protein
MLEMGEQSYDWEDSHDYFFTFSSIDPISKIQPGPDAIREDLLRTAEKMSMTTNSQVKMQANEGSIEAALEYGKRFVTPFVEFVRFNNLH